MASRYTYSTCLSFGEDGEPGYSEIDVTVSYCVAWGRPETPPAYDHGGLPAEPDEIDDIRLELINGKPRPWNLGDGWVSEESQEEMILSRFDGFRYLDDMLQEARDREAAWAE